jgi:tetrahydromethanopterin S-methyltransferase subunit G
VSTPASSSPGDTRPGDDRSLGEIVSDVAQDLSTLVRQELDLAKTEVKQEAGRAGRGVGLLGGAGVAGHLALIFVSLCAVFVLNNGVPLELAALIVAVFWGIVAAILAMTGKKALDRTQPALPETQRSLKEDVAWARQQKS